MSELQDRIAERLAALDRSQLAGLDLDKREKFIKTAIGLLYACGWRAAEPKAVVTITDDCNRSDVADALIIRLDCSYFPTNGTNLCVYLHQSVNFPDRAKTNSLDENRQSPQSARDIHRPGTTAGNGGCLYPHPATNPDARLRLLSLRHLGALADADVAAIIALCTKLNLCCVLEGVETAEEMAVLAPLKPDLVQGYLYGRPMSAEDARQLLQKQNSENFQIASQAQRLPQKEVGDFNRLCFLRICEIRWSSEWPGAKSPVGTMPGERHAMQAT